MSFKLVASWVLGGVLLLMGSWIMTHLELGIGVSEVSFVLATIIALVLFLIAGLLWISVAVATRHEH